MLDKVGRRAASSLNARYLRVGQASDNRLFGIPPPIDLRGPSIRSGQNVNPIQMLVSERGRIKYGRLTVVIVGLFTLAVGIILSSIPWLDYFILKNLRLWNGTLSYYYWQKPGVARFTKVFVFNVTNSDGFLNLGQKPKLEEVGPFVYRENMEKVNVKFHDNGTVSFQHKKILHFVPEMSASPDSVVVVPNIPLLTLTSMFAETPAVLRMGLSLGLKALYRMPLFNRVTVEQLLFGYDESLTSLANMFYPKWKKPPPKLGLLLTRNSSLLNDVATIYTGHTGMENFGLMNRLNGLDHLTTWNGPHCNNIKASEGSFFPPRDVTHADVVNIWDKDLCRVWPLRYRKSTVKDHIDVDYYTIDDNAFDYGEKNPQNECFCSQKNKCPPDGFQSISPCQFHSPLYTSLPHFMGITDPDILNSVEGMKPDPEKHTSSVLIQPKLGVPLEAIVRVQANLKVTQAHNTLVKKFPSMMFPIIWVEEGVKDLPEEITRWILLGTTVASTVGPILSYGLIVIGASTLALIFVRTYRSVFLPELERVKRRAVRRSSSFLVNGQQRLLILRDSYTLLQNVSAEPGPATPESPREEQV